MLQMTDKSIRNDTQRTQAKNQDILDIIGGASSVRVGRSIKNLSITVKLTKPKKSDSAKNNSSRTDFLTPKAKKAFIHL